MTEFGLLAKKGIIAFTDGIKTIQNTRLMSRIMNSAQDLGCLIMQHAEDLHLSDNGMINSGIIASKLGLSGIPDIAERIIIERDLTLLEKIKCRYHISQLSSSKSVDIIKQRKEEIKFTSGVSINNLSLNENGGLVIDELGKIEAVGKKVNNNNLPSREKLVDLKGKYIFPGIVDMRVFVGEPGYEYKENFRTLSNAALSGGVTSCLLYTSDAADE